MNVEPVLLSLSKGYVMWCTIARRLRIVCWIVDVGYVLQPIDPWTSAPHFGGTSLKELKHMCHLYHYLLPLPLRGTFTIMWHLYHHVAPLPVHFAFTIMLQWNFNRYK